MALQPTIRGAASQTAVEGLDMVSSTFGAGGALARGLKHWSESVEIRAHAHKTRTDLRCKIDLTVDMRELEALAKAEKVDF